MKLFRLFIVLLIASAGLFGSDTRSPRRLDVSYPSNGITIKGWLYLPSDDTLMFPAIVLSTGFSGVKECNYDLIAEQFSSAGYAVLLFDHPNFGESGGEPRQEVDPMRQVDAYRDGISWLLSHSSVDNHRIGVWGGSFSGGHALITAALDSRVRCVVSLTPMLSGSSYFLQLPESNRKKLQEMFRYDRQERFAGKTPMYIPVTSDDPSVFTAVRGKPAWDFYQTFQSRAARFQNRVTLRSLEHLFAYEPAAYLNRLAPTPALVILLSNDELVDNAYVKREIQKLPGTHEITFVEGNHFSPYMEKLEESARMAIDWFNRYLK